MGLSSVLVINKHLSHQYATCKNRTRNKTQQNPKGEDSKQQADKESDSEGGKDMYCIVTKIQTITTAIYVNI